MWTHMIKNVEVVSGHCHYSKNTDLCNRVACWAKQTISCVFILVNITMSAQLRQCTGPPQSNQFIRPTSMIMTINTAYATWRLVLRGSGFKTSNDCHHWLWHCCWADWWTDGMKGCSQGSKPKTGPKWTQKENIPKQRKYKYLTSLKLWSPFKNHFYPKNLLITKSF